MRRVFSPAILAYAARGTGSLVSPIVRHHGPKRRLPRIHVVFCQMQCGYRERSSVWTGEKGKELEVIESGSCPKEEARKACGRDRIPRRLRMCWQGEHTRSL